MPSPISHALIERTRPLLEAHYLQRGSLSREQRRNPLEKDWQQVIRPVRAALEKLFDGKCAYCETRIGVSGPMDVDHFRPKAGATDLSGAASLDHYGWLILDWDNHYSSCPACNRAKRALFPVDGLRAPPITSLDLIIASERPLLLDPCRDDPEQHLEFRPDGSVRAVSERGEVTIKVLNLNRGPLVDDRRRAYLSTLLQLQQLSDPNYLPELLTKPTEPYIAVIRQAIADHFKAPTLHEPSKAVPEEVRRADEVFEDKQAYLLNARSLARVEIRNFRALRHVDLRFAEQTGEAAPWLVLLGENATGKSSILQSIGLALGGAEEASRFTRPGKVLSYGAVEGRIVLHFFDKEVPTELIFRRGQASFTGTEMPSAIVLGFGALRYAEARRSRRTEPPVTNFVKLAPLLRPIARIPHPAPWLLSLDPEQFAVAARCLRDLLPIGNESELIRTRDRVLFKLGDHEATLAELSSGYQTIVGMACAIMRLLLERWENLISATGIVLIDELDAHLHPRWKMRIVSSLRQAFPQVQFLVSTHDPLVLRGVRNNEVAVLRREPRRGTVVDQELPPIEGMQVEDLLTSRHFGLESLLDPEVEERLAELYHLQSLPRTAELATRIAALRDTIGDREALGRNRREQVMLLTADQFLRETPDRDEQGIAPRLATATLSRLQALIDGGKAGRE